MSSLHSEIGIMVAILVGAWAAKVAALALYLFCHRRRLRRLAASGESGLPTACPCHKPTPQDVITSLPVTTYADAVQQLKAGHSGSSGAKQGPSKHPAAAAASAAVSADTIQQRDQQQLNTEEHLDRPPHQATTAAAAEEQQQTVDLPKSSAFSLSGAAGDSSSEVGRVAAGQDLLMVQPQTGSSEAECCPICFGEYDSANVEVRQLPCRHYFHPECIDAWLVRDNTCPLCKSLVWTPDRSAAADEDAGQQQQQQQQQQQSQGHAQLLHVIVIGGAVPRQQQL